MNYDFNENIIIKAYLDSYVKNFENIVGFSELVIHFNLDKSKDFKYSDLSFVDFGSADLKDFNFTGAILKNCRADKVTWDSTTIFDDADCSGSVFQPYINTLEARKKNPGIDEEIKRLSRDHWASLSLNLLRKKANSNYFNLNIYFQSKDPTVRKDALYGLSQNREGLQYLKDMLMSFYRFNINSDYVSSMKDQNFDILTRLFKNDKDFFDLFYEIFNSESSLEIDKSRSVLFMHKSKFIKLLKPIDYFKLFDQKNVSFRRMFVGFLIDKADIFDKSLMFDFIESNYFDYVDFKSDLYIAKMAYEQLHQIKRYNYISEKNVFKNSADSFVNFKIDRSEILNRIFLIKREIQSLADYAFQFGIKF